MHAICQDQPLRMRCRACLYEMVKGQKAEIERLLAFASRVHDVCNKHIEGRATVDAHACGDCPVWTLRAEAADAEEGG